MELAKDEIREIIKEELVEHKPVITTNLVRWFIGVFGVFIILLSINIGMYKIRFANTETDVRTLKETVVKKSDYRYQLTEYRTDYMWSEQHGGHIPQPPTSTRGGGTSQ